MTFLQKGDEDIRRQREREGVERRLCRQLACIPKVYKVVCSPPSRCVGAGERSFSGHLSLPHPSAHLWNTAALNVKAALIRKEQQAKKMIPIES
ncbi:hypothetical protein NPIL_564311 [Nephila pilipes]|uniref:Uncharacterized protein n=1 Tax=Nephila pilipes TaxID=299642 RepID=A0A8X6PMP8_NEPPI|nr:hypothetical protein NPIL_564311 [Nephila pilipes]